MSRAAVWGFGGQGFCVPLGLVAGGSGGFGFLFGVFAGYGAFPFVVAAAAGFAAEDVVVVALLEEVSTAPVGAGGETVRVEVGVLGEIVGNSREQ